MNETYTNSFINIVIFILTTYAYFILLKPTIKYNDLTDQSKLGIYYANSYTFLAIYLIVVIIIQCLINVNIINNKCGGSVSENIGYASLITIFPWILIFGVTLVVLTIYPSFKSAFSDVIGYYYVSNSANKIITEILENKSVEDTINPVVSPEDRTKIQSTADALIKICGDTGLLINQMTQRNFVQFWDMLTPLKKQQFKNDENEETKKIREQLFQLVVTKENIGEAMWYVYTGSLVASVVQLNVASKGCANNLNRMEKNYKNFIDKKEAAEKKSAEEKKLAQKAAEEKNKLEMDEYSNMPTFNGSAY